MSITRSFLLAIAALGAGTAGASAGFAAIAATSSGTVVDVAVASPQHKTLVAAVQAAGLVDTLSASGPFTVFAPVDSAFAALPGGTVETLLQPANRSQLQGLLTYHVVAGRVSASDLIAQIRREGGHARLTTVEGSPLTARLVGNDVIVTDERGGRARVVAADLEAGNGVVHATDAVFMMR